MTIYGKAAVIATQACHADSNMSPKLAWAQGIRESSTSVSTCAKVCPREAFLGLCAAGLIPGIDPAAGAQLGKNAQYAIRAVKLLRVDPNLARNPAKLWGRVVGRGKVANGQMGVVVALWETGLIQNR
jgi:hypothetical protein